MIPLVLVTGFHTEVCPGVASAQRIVCIAQGAAGERVEQVWRAAEQKGEGTATNV